MTYYRFRMRLFVRDESFRPKQNDKLVKHDCTAESETLARRDAFEKARFNHCWITKFASVKSEPLSLE